MNDKKVKLNIFNHPSTKGIEDYIHYLRYTLESQDLPVDISNLAPRYGNMKKNEGDDINIIIEFDEKGNVYNQYEDKDKIGIVATEFISESGFNQFLTEDKQLDTYLNKIKAQNLIKFLNTARSGKEKMKILKGRKLFAVRLIKLIRILMIDSRLTIKLLKAYISGKSLDEFGYRISLNLRYRNFMNNLGRFEIIIVASKALLENYKRVLDGIIDVVYLPPLIPTGNLSKIKQEDKNTNIFFSGRMTKHRKSVIQELTCCQEITDIKSTLEINIGTEKSQSTMFVDISQGKERGEYNLTHELYIGQSSKWIYASPMRTYRTLRMGYIPVSDKKYEDEIIEVSILPNLDDMEVMLEKVYKYNSWAKEIVKETIERIL